MCYENPAFIGRALQDFRIAGAFKFCIGSRRKVYGRLSLANRNHDGKPEIGIRLEANAQERGSLILARARWSFSQCTELAFSRGTVFVSNSRFRLGQVFVDLRLMVQVEGDGAVDLRSLQ